MLQEDIDYINKLIPSEGWICVGQLVKGGAFRHYWYLSVEEAIARFEGLDNAGHNSYLAMASFTTDQTRAQKNAASLKSCFLDIDCGVEKPYPTQKDGVAALYQFCSETGLPVPSILNSGNGLYAAWHFSDDVPAGLWKNTAQLLKELTIQKKFLVDQSRTADSSSVLRPPGVRNWKDPANPKPVRVLHDAPLLQHNEFHQLLAKAVGVRAVPVRISHNKQIDEFVADVSGPPSDPNKIADKCMQMSAMRSTGGDLPEPLWYAMLCVLRVCEDGHNTAHTWSQGHSGYSPAETDKKLNQSSTGPSTCDFIAYHNPEGCIGCRFQGKIRSPITLGAPEPVALATVEDSPFPEPPQGYRISETGVFRKVEDEWEMVYKHPLFVDALVADSALGHEIAVIKHRDPQRVWQELGLRSALIHDKKQMLMALHDQHLQAPVGDAEKVFMYYITQAIQKMRDTAPVQAASHQMGWKEPKVAEDPMTFVLGSELFHKDGTIQKFTLSKVVPEIVKAYHSKGSTDAWVSATAALSDTGYEPQAFALVAGAFGSPLMRFTGFKGALVSMVGSSGVGKTLIGNMILSAYGDPAHLMLLRDDTRNAMISRLGVYGSLPCYVDEVSNMPGEELSDFAYRITQGRDKARLTKASVERSNLNSWNTVCVASSNHSIVERLAAHKSDASAEFNRIIEYTVEQEFDRSTATDMYRAVLENYGGVGRVYAQYLVAHQTELRGQLDILVADIDSRTGAGNEERFWSATIACTILGGMIARKLGLVAFDVSRLMGWATQTVFEMRNNKADSQQDTAAVISAIMDRYMGNTVIVSDSSKNNNVGDPYMPVRGRVEARMELLTGDYWISKATLRDELQRRYVSWAKFKSELGDSLVNSSARLVLGRGTWLASAPQSCVHIKLQGKMSDKLNLVKVMEASKETKKEFKA